jgi:hypothetical protein
VQSRGPEHVCQAIRRINVIFYDQSDDFRWVGCKKCLDFLECVQCQFLQSINILLIHTLYSKTPSGGHNWGRHIQ